MVMMKVIVQTASGRRIGHVTRIEFAVEKIVVVVGSNATAATPRKDRIDRYRYRRFQLHCGGDAAATTDQ
jgi:hypothetical protein